MDRTEEYWGDEVSSSVFYSSMFSDIKINQLSGCLEPHPMTGQ